MVDIEKLDAALDPEVRKLWLRVLPRLLEVLGEPDQRQGTAGERGAALAAPVRIAAIQSTPV